MFHNWSIQLIETENKLLTAIDELIANHKFFFGPPLGKIQFFVALIENNPVFAH